MTDRADDLGYAILALVDDKEADYSQAEILSALAKATGVCIVTGRADIDTYIAALRGVVKEARAACIDLVLRPQDRKVGEGEA